MRIEEVEELDARLPQGESDCACDARCVAETAVEALRAEAWHPIEKAEEMGAKDGRDVIVWDANTYWFEAHWSTDEDRWLDGHYVLIDCNPTHFRFINPPEEA